MKQTEQKRPPPTLDAGQRILVAGATGGIGRSVTGMLHQSPGTVVGVHGRSHGHARSGSTEIPLTADLGSRESCDSLVSTFIDRAGGIDALVVLVGGMERPKPVQDISQSSWDSDITLNLSVPFFLAQSALKAMERQATGGRIILTSTESALHGGGPESFAYGVAKAGTECMIKGLARAGAPSGILVNGVRFGFIDSGFHSRWQGKTDNDMIGRAQLVPLKRGGTTDEAAALICYLLSGWAAFMTGEIVSLSGGDWL